MFQFTPLVRGATLDILYQTINLVSIHAPRARGDYELGWYVSSIEFQFTPLVRGATCRRGSANLLRRFNSRPSCEGRPEAVLDEAVVRVSIHAPRARGDAVAAIATAATEFQFTPLVRGATIAKRMITIITSFNSRPSCEGRLTPRRNLSKLIVSIHAPRARGDGVDIGGGLRTNVSIHAPRARGDI